jgi:hypothetical protein
MPPVEDMRPESVSNYDPNFDIDTISDETAEEEIVPESSKIENVQPVSTEVVATTATPITVKATEPELDYSSFEELTPREKALIARLEAVTGSKFTPDVQQTSSEQTVEAVVNKIEDFIGEDVDIDDVLTKDGLNTLLVKVYSRALDQAKTLAAEQILQSLPQTISTYVTQHTAQQAIVQNFYTNNPDLANVKRTLAAVANEVAAENPSYTLDQVFENAATKTRVRLGLKKPADDVVSTKSELSAKSVRPAFVNQRGTNSRVRVPELSGLAKEIADMDAVS